jgi:hypothetical protein
MTWARKWNYCENTCESACCHVETRKVESKIKYYIVLYRYHLWKITSSHCKRPVPFSLHKAAVCESICRIQTNFSWFISTTKEEDLTQTRSPPVPPPQDPACQRPSLQGPQALYAMRLFIRKTLFVHSLGVMSSSRGTIEFHIHICPLEFQNHCESKRR